MFTAKDARDFMPIARQERKDAQIKDITEFLESKCFTEAVQSAIRSKKSEAVIRFPEKLDREFVVEELVKNGYFINCNYSDYRELFVSWEDSSTNYLDR